GGRMIGVFVVRGILIEIDPGQTGENERRGVRFELDFVADLDFANIGKRAEEWRKRRKKIAAAAKLEFPDGTLAQIEHKVAQMILHFAFVLFDVGQRAKQALLFPGEEHETNGAARAKAGLDDGLGGSENAR